MRATTVIWVAFLSLLRAFTTLDSMQFPRLLDVRQNFPRSTPLAIDEVVKREFQKKDFNRPLDGKRVAVGVGSRGISNLKQIVAAVLRELHARGASPFIVPAMGSHGGATPEGQAHILETYGITPASMGVPFETTMETVCIGTTTADAIPVNFSAAALKANWIFPINRVKPHTDFHADLGSGLLKMLAIGFGKQAGAAACHAASSRLGYERVLRQVAGLVLNRAPILGGLAILENQFHDTADLALLTPDTLEVEEARLLVRARELMPRLPFAEIDLLIVDQMGKNISGAGMDPNVIGRAVRGYTSSLVPQPGVSPNISRIFVRGLTAASSGNAVGIGMADFTTTGTVASIDLKTTYVNALTALTPQTVKIPIHFNTDREVVEQALQSLALENPASARVVQIRDTLSLEVMRVSTAYANELNKRTDVVALGSESEMRFDAEGSLVPVDGIAVRMKS